MPISVGDEVTAYVRHAIAGFVAAGETWRAMGERLGVQGATLHHIHASNARVGPKVEVAFAELLHGGSIDALRATAKRFYEETGEEDRRLLIENPESKLALEQLDEVTRARLQALAWELLDEGSREDARALALSLHGAGGPWVRPSAALITSDDSEVVTLARPLAGAVISILGGPGRKRPKGPPDNVAHAQSGPRMAAREKRPGKGRR